VGILHVENCSVSGFTDDGLLFAGAGKLEIKDSTFKGNGAIGVNVVAGSGTAIATVERVRLEGCATGLVAGSGSKVTVRNSVASNNEAGFSAFGGPAPVELNLEKCEASNNSNGVVAENQGIATITVRVSNSTVTNNTFAGLHNTTGASGVIFSRGNNTIVGNAMDTIGAIDSYSPK
jgi:hypothetical protein